MSIVTTTGSFSGGGGVPTGMFRLTLWSCTGIVMISMMISTSITSISGVVLMAETTSSSSPSEPTVMAIVRSRSAGRGHRCQACAHQDAVQVGTEAAHRFHRHLVAANEPVVAEHRRHRDSQADRRHDQRFANRPRDLVDRR